MTPEEETELIEMVRKVKERTGRSVYKIDRRTLNELRAQEGEPIYVDTGPLPLSRDSGRTETNPPGGGKELE